MKSGTDREKDEGPRAGIEATQSDNILMKKGLEIVEATRRRPGLKT